MEVQPVEKCGESSGVSKSMISKRRSYVALIQDAIIALKDRNGSSRRSILKYVLANAHLPQSPMLVKCHLNRAIGEALKKGIIKYTKVGNVILTDCYKLNISAAKMQHGSKDVTLPPIQQSSMLLQLPTEMLETIFSHICDSYSIAERCSKTLPLGLVCQDFYQLIPPIALREVGFIFSPDKAVTNPNAMESFSTCLTDSRALHTTKIYLEMLIRDEHLPHLIPALVHATNLQEFIFSPPRELCPRSPTPSPPPSPPRPTGPMNMSRWPRHGMYLRDTLLDNMHISAFENLCLLMSDTNTFPQFTKLRVDTNGHDAEDKFMAAVARIGPRVKYFQFIGHDTCHEPFATQLAPFLCYLKTLDLSVSPYSYRNEKEEAIVGLSISKHCVSLTELKFGIMSNVIFIKAICARAACACSCCYLPDESGLGFHATIETMEVTAAPTAGGRIPANQVIPLIIPKLNTLSKLKRFKLVMVELNKDNELVPGWSDTCDLTDFR